MKNALVALCALALFTVVSQCRAEGVTPKHSLHFVRYDNCEFIPTAYADGKSWSRRAGWNGVPLLPVAQQPQVLSGCSRCSCAERNKEKNSRKARCHKPKHRSLRMDRPRRIRG